ncbi:MAG: hypothetical protein UX13_C0026G0032 [Candidatus Woesebacteria bacterium GW2011_GWB1_45_5]|uniref:Membrane-bound metal-dependent hydrolase n=1 Tax=Candidatus Woesebacteria bacterium GW2011_GWB1_45_5 TaxID=1618581 RepID=A0A0G1MNI1_9BACT|nr:MAG: hypothetical protein UX13_C0026G0032 [Candidatus Woesebacteria bacterium GW2011_GWB1_45_5]
MRRELFLHYAFWFSFFVFITIVNGFFDLLYWPFWVGGIVGTLLPDIDHLLYIYLKPQELTSQRVNFFLDRREIKRIIGLLYETRSERRDLIFHTIFFQLIFLVLTFWMISSSGSLFGRGLVLAFALHLSVDQIVDLTEMQSFDNWFKNLPFRLDLKQSQIYWVITLLIVLVFGFLL